MKGRIRASNSPERQLRLALSLNRRPPEVQVVYGVIGLDSQQMCREQKPDRTTWLAKHLVAP